MRIDEDILIDAGTGVGDLSLEQLAKIDHVFLTHSHLDHVACLPLLVDTVCWMRERPLVVHSTKETIRILKEHLFNWKIWPDFSQIPDGEKPFMVYEEIEVGKTVRIGERCITPVPANHVVPAVGYLMDSGRASLLFSGDTAANDALWEVANRTENLKYLIIETAFPDKEAEIALASKHLSPGMLVRELGKLKRNAEIYITHLKPGEVALTMSEIRQQAARWNPRMLENGMTFEI
jgi:ribonuclease BN (tRNA processing enzyme)